MNNQNQQTVLTTQQNYHLTDRIQPLFPNPYNSEVKPASIHLFTNSKSVNTEIIKVRVAYKSIWGIYRAVCLTTGAVYTGCAKIGYIHSRMRSHLVSLKNTNSNLKSCIETLGINNIAFVIMQVMDLSHITDKEAQLYLFEVEDWYINVDRRVEDFNNSFFKAKWLDNQKWITDIDLALRKTASEKQKAYLATLSPEELSLLRERLNVASLPVLKILRENSPEYVENHRAQTIKGIASQKSYNRVAPLKAWTLKNSMNYQVEVSEVLSNQEFGPITVMHVSEVPVFASISARSVSSALNVVNHSGIIQSRATKRKYFLKYVSRINDI